MRPLLALPAAVLLLVSGCLGGSDGTSSSTTTASSGPAVLPAFALDNDAAGCYEAIGILLVDMAVAQAALPANWTAADAQAALSTPQPTGKGAVWFNGHRCGNSTLAGGPAQGAEFGILVQAPRLSGPASANATPSTFNVYSVFQATDAPAALAALGSVGFPARAANVSVDRVTGVGGAEVASVLVGNGTRTFYSFEYTAILPDTFTGTADFWHETPGGMASFHYEISGRAVLQGAIGACNFPDPEVQKVTGMPSCGPGTQAFAVVIPQQEWTSEFRWQPGVRAVAG